MSLKRAAFSAGRWTATSAALVAGMQLLQTMVLARLLLPAEFGLMAVAASVLAILSLIADMGLSRALVHFDDVPSDTMSSLYWLNLGVSLVLALLLAISAPAVGVLYDSQAIVAVLQAASLMFPLTALGQQFRVMAQKDLRFAALARNEIAAAVIGFGSAVAVALGGGGVYALVAGMLASAVASSVLAWWHLSRGIRPSLHFSFGETRPYLRFGGYLLGDSFANTLNRQADVFIGGLLLGPAAIGIYSVPRDLSLRVAMAVNPIITRVGFPIMSRVKNDREKLKSIYLHTLRMTASTNFPIYLALGLFADDIVALLYGPQWHGAGLYLRILAIWGLVRSLANPVGSLLYAVGRAQLAFWWNLALLALCPITLWVGTRFAGLSGLAWTMLLVQLAIVVPQWKFLVRPCCGAGLGAYLGAILRPLIIALLAGAFAWLVTVVIVPGWLRLLAGGMAGGFSYLGLSLYFNRSWTDAMLELFHLRPSTSSHPTSP